MFPNKSEFFFWGVETNGNKNIEKHHHQDKLGSGPSPRKLPAQPGRMGKS